MRRKNGQFKKGMHWRPAQVFRQKRWLHRNYVVLGRSTGDIALQFGVKDAAILFWLKRHGIPRRSMSQARALKRWGVSGPDNPMWNRRGELNPSWRGGVTPQRQAFYASSEWRRACSFVWKRDNAKCQRCCADRRTSPDLPMHIHHIVGFADADLRADPSNLVLLCEVCHRFVHSRRNTKREYLPKV